jgi:hypothetical protein
MGERTTLGRQWAAPSSVQRRMRPLVWADPRATIGSVALTDRTVVVRVARSSALAVRDRL